MKNDDEVNQRPWRPIEEMPQGAHAWGSLEYQAEVSQWQKLRPQLESTKHDKKIMEIWVEERSRRFAIETGQVEGLYALPGGITEELVSEGLESVRLSHTPVSSQVEDGGLLDLLKDQKEALEVVFDTVAQRRPLSHSSLKEWHQLLTRHQAFATGRQGGQIVNISLRKGDYKIRPNNPREPDGRIFEYCPPEHVRSEMDRLFSMYEEVRAERYPTEVEAAWLHHRYILIHPFQDGNGRTARLLMAYAYMRRHEFPPIIDTLGRDLYIDVLQEADDGNLQPFTKHLATLATGSIRGAIVCAKKVLRSDLRYHHSNGTDTYKASGSSEWKHGPGDDRLELFL